MALVTVYLIKQFYLLIRFYNFLVCCMKYFTQFYVVVFSAIKIVSIPVMSRDADERTWKLLLIICDRYLCHRNLIHSGDELH